MPAKPQVQGGVAAMSISDRHVKWTCLVLACAAVLASVCGLPLIWDGAYQFVLTLRDQHPFFYLTRFHTALLWWPCVWVSRFTENLTVLMLAYGLPFLAAPAVSLWISWRIVRRHRPELAVWAAFGVTAAALPGQVFVINDSIWQQTLFWPLFLAMFVPLSRAGKCAVALLAIFQLVHQVGVLLLALALLAAMVSAKIQPHRRRELRWQIAMAGVFLFLAVAKTAWISIPGWAGAMFDSYAAQQATWHEAVRMLSHSSGALPGLALMWGAAGVIVFRGRARWLVVLIGLGAAMWTAWAVQPRIWVGAIDYRRWVVPFALPFYACAFFEAVRPRILSQPWRGRVCLALAAVYAFVLGIQSLEWRREVRHLMTAVQKSAQPLVTPADAPWMRGTPLDHWGATALVMATEGKTPRHYFAYDEACRAALLADPPQIALWSLHHVPPDPGRAGYYDYRPLLQQLKNERESKHPIAEGERPRL